jgi:tRNA (mo5U34)-methyltransferase
VQWRAGNIYDLDPAVHGEFDVVVVGSLLVHLRDPVRALDAVRKVARGGHLLSADYVNPSLTVLARRRPLFELRGETADFQWWLASEAGLRQLLHVGGFAIEDTSKYFVLRPGAGENAQGAGRGRRELGRRMVNRVLAGDGTPGAHLHRAYLAHPRF